MFKDSTISNNITYSVQAYIDDLFVKNGATFDIINSSGQYGNLSTLTQLNHPNYAQGKVWGSRRKNWLWEPEGIHISGVWVNNVLQTSGYRINYRDGYVLFDNVTSGTVKLNYSFKYIEVKNASDTNFLRLDTQSFNIIDSQFITGSGFPNIQDRTQLPCISLQTVNSSKTEAFELGSATKKHINTMIIHVISEDGLINDKIRDLIQVKEETYVGLFDYEKSKMSGVYPLSRDGFLVNSGGTYTNLITYYPFNKALYKNRTVSDSFVSKVINEGSVKLHNSLYHGTLRITFETILSV